MRSYHFAVRVEGFDASDDDATDALVMLDEVLLLSEVDGVVTVDLEVDAAAPDRAVRACVHLIESAVPGVRVQQVDLDLVAAADVADRVGVSRQAVTNWAAGRRSGQAFPDPLGTLAGGTRVWSWSSVEPWLNGAGHQAEPPSSLPYETIVSVNALLQRPRQPGRLATVGDWARPELRASAGRTRVSVGASRPSRSGPRLEVVVDGARAA